jgi:hypothetical protein
VSLILPTSGPVMPTKLPPGFVKVSTGAVDDECTILQSSLLSFHILCFDILIARLAFALDSSPCVSLNVKMSAPACLISLNAESSLMPSRSNIPLIFWQYILTYCVVSSGAMSSHTCPNGRLSSVTFVFFFTCCLLSSLLLFHLMVLYFRLPYR